MELLVVIDVAMTETARLAHYVLPAATQFEKAEATFFNLEFPHNTFQLRHRLFEPLEGTLPEPEIWSRLVRALGVVDDSELEPLRTAAAVGRDAFAQAFLAAAAASPMLAKTTPYVLYETLGPTLPDGLAGAAALWGLAQKAFFSLSGRGAPRRPRRRQRAVRGDPVQSVRRDVHRPRIRRRLRADRPRRPPDQPEPARDARRDPRAARRESPNSPRRSTRSCWRRGSGAPTPPTTSSATPAGAGGTPTGRCGSASKTPDLGLVDGGRARITTAAGSAEATVEVS